MKSVPAKIPVGITLALVVLLGGALAFKNALAGSTLNWRVEARTGLALTMPDPPQVDLFSLRPSVSLVNAAIGATDGASSAAPVEIDMARISVDLQESLSSGRLSFGSFSLSDTGIRIDDLIKPLNPSATTDESADGDTAGTPASAASTEERGPGAGWPGSGVDQVLNTLRQLPVVQNLEVANLALRYTPSDKAFVQQVIVDRLTGTIKPQALSALDATGKTTVTLAPTTTLANADRATDASGDFLVRGSIDLAEAAQATRTVSLV